METTNNDSKHISFYFDTNLLDEIENTPAASEDAVAVLLNDLNEKSAIDKYPGFLYTSGYEDIFEILNNSSAYFFGDQKDAFSLMLDEIQKSNEEDIVKWYKALELFSNKLKVMGGFIFTALSPSGGEDCVFLAFKNTQRINGVLLLYHFYEAKNSGSGWFDEFITDFDMPFEDYIDKNSYSAKKDTTILEYKFEDSPFGISCDSNSKYLGINESIFNTCLLGLKSAKQFC